MISNISIHAPRAGSDTVSTVFLPSLSIFQSTLPVRGATANQRAWFTEFENFNPRSPCGERPNSMLPNNDLSNISIHAPRAGSDLTVLSGFLFLMIFQSTLPVRGATASYRGGWCYLVISIHAPRAGSDVLLLTACRCLSANFNPRSPCGERRVYRCPTAGR